MCNEQATGTLDEIGQKDHSVTSEYRIFGPRERARQPTSPARSDVLLVDTDRHRCW